MEAEVEGAQVISWKRMSTEDSKCLTGGDFHFPIKVSQVFVNVSCYELSEKRRTLLRHSRIDD